MFLLLDVSSFQMPHCKSFSGRDTLSLFLFAATLGGTLVLGWWQCPGRALKPRPFSPAVLERAICRRCNKSSVATWLRTKKLRTTFLFYVMIATKNCFFCVRLMPSKSLSIFIYIYLDSQNIDCSCCIWFADFAEALIVCLNIHN